MLVSRSSRGPGHCSNSNSNSNNHCQRSPVHSLTEAIALTSESPVPVGRLVHSGLAVVNISRDRKGWDGTGHDRVHAQAGRKAEDTTQPQAEVGATRTGQSQQPESTLPGQVRPAPGTTRHDRRWDGTGRLGISDWKPSRVTGYYSILSLRATSTQVVTFKLKVKVRGVDNRRRGLARATGRTVRRDDDRTRPRTPNAASC